MKTKTDAVPRRNYRREALLLCARDLEAHYDNADGFHLDDTEPDCTPRQAKAFRRALRDVIRSLYLRAGVEWTHQDDFDVELEAAIRSRP